MQQQQLKTKEIIASLTVGHCPGIGPAKFRRLLNYWKTPLAVIDADREQLIKTGLTEDSIQFLKNPNMHYIKEALHWLEQPQHHLLTTNDNHYPLCLKECHNTPPLLYVSGQTTTLNNPKLALVGSRNPSPYGQECAFQFAHDLTKAGLTITSGLAIGIDGVSHRGALAAGGQTIAVLGSGLNQIYPLRHQKLADEIIAANGALVSEFPLNMRAHQSHFPQRNRIISGLSLGTCVIEATIASGSLITARYALEQGREIFAVPHSLRNPGGSGCHYLIQQGAKCVTSISDILSELEHLLNSPSNRVDFAPTLPISSPLAKPINNLIECINDAPTSIDQIMHRCNLPREVVMSQLLDLEIKGYISWCVTGYIREQR